MENVLGDVTKAQEENMAMIQVVKSNDPRLAEAFGVKSFPKLLYVHGGDPILYTGKRLLWGKTNLDIP